MTTFRQFLTGFKNMPDPAPGLFQKEDDTVWLKQPDGTEVQISGGGGGGFTGWTEDDSDPANVSTNGGSLNLGGSTISDISFLQTIALATNPQSEGALPTVTFVSGTGRHIGGGGDCTVYVPWTTDGTNNAATLKVELSPDNTTYSTLATLSVAAALNTLGAVTLMETLYVPNGWFVKLTASHCTIGTSAFVGPNAG